VRVLLASKLGTRPSWSPAAAFAPPSLSFTVTTASPSVHSADWTADPQC